MTDEQKVKAFNTISSYASPHITLSYVVDDAGKVLGAMHIHPQIASDCILTLDVMTDFGSEKEEVLLSPMDVRSFAARLNEFADTAEAIIGNWSSENQ